MSRAKRQAPRYEPEPEDEELDAEETLSSMLDVLVMMLRLQACDSCMGTGRMPENGSFVPCVCRHMARALLEEFSE